LVWKRWIISSVLFLAGALLLAKGSFAVYPFLFPTEPLIVASRDDVDSLEAQRFLPGQPLFRLSLPRQGIRWTVVEGTSQTVLREGPGHLEGSPLPGAPGNSVIAGHRDTHFRPLKNISIGDEIRVEIDGKIYSYEVTETRTVSPTNIAVLQSDGEKVITLITCYPFYFIGPAPSRFIVRARAIDN
jgi:sortase A